ncbi:hypothetical protein, partial [Anaeromassilibacillus senegalensis]|uniref:hypothetical protein n=1 Tax=Anaeromassilibacillus senegalensis TaxID=1673717 RepID=UPI001A9A42A4
MPASAWRDASSAQKDGYKRQKAGGGLGRIGGRPPAGKKGAKKQKKAPTISPKEDVTATFFDLT